ncbi:MAG: cobyrinate a,c-diamide synthase [Eubacteriaceae bacterium]
MQYFMLAGANSNVGKTTITMGIMAAYKKRGLSVQPFKTGPDYIDPMFHNFVTGEKSINLDTWLLDEETVLGLFQRRLTHGNLGIVEGVMGLYDGHSLETDLGSSAYLSKVIKAPVILIVDGRGISKSLAALVKGYLDFDPQTKIEGIIINQLSSEAHYQLLKKMIEFYCDVPCLGYFPKTNGLSMESRHLGLIPVEELQGFKEKIEKARILAEAHIDLDRLLEIAQSTEKTKAYIDPFLKLKKNFAGLKIGVPRDKAFNFYYEDNFKALETCGVEIIFFSPLEDKKIPEGIHGLYIGGGFPEIFGEKLAQNQSLRKEILEALEKGLPCYAECGGLMYLTQSMRLLTGKETSGIGFFNGFSKMTKGLQNFGYATLETTLLEKEITMRVHEFHHSKVEIFEKTLQVYKLSKKEKSWDCGYQKKNTLGGYPHIHFYSQPQFLETLLEVAKGWKEG